MKKQILFLLVVLSLIAMPLWAENPGVATGQAAHFFADSKTIKLQVSGSAIALADPLAGPFPVLTNMEGSGNIGQISGQGMYLYNQLEFDIYGESILEVLEGQTSCRFKINGDVLLVVFDPGKTGWLQITDLATGSAVFEQEWTGKIVGGTGRFEGVKGTFSKSARGFAVLFTEYGPANAVVMPWTGTMKIQMEQLEE